MAQHDQIISDGSGADVRADINAAFAAVFSSNSGPTAPLVTVAGQLWFDTGNDRMNMRNPTNTGWTIITANFDPSNVYTKTAADARFLPINGAYTKTESDGRFAPIGTRYTKADIDAKFNPLIDASFAPSAAPTKLMHFDNTLIAAGQDRGILIPNANATVGGWELCYDDTFSGVTERIFLDLGAFHTLDVVGQLQPISANASFNLYVSANNGGAWINTANHYQIGNYSSGAATPTGFYSSTDGGFYLTTGNLITTGNASRGCNFAGRFFGFNKATRYTRMKMEQAYQGAANLITLDVTGGLPVSQAHNAMRIGSAGVTFQGRVTIHGLRG